MSKPRKSTVAPQTAPEPVCPIEEPAPQSTPAPTPAVEQPHRMTIEEYFGQAPACLEIAAADSKVAQIETAIARAVEAKVPAHELYVMHRSLLHAKAEAAFPVRADRFTDQQLQDLAANRIHPAR